jgi:phosphoserine aminotransferase
MGVIYNFNAGPAMVANEVMEQAHAEFFNWRGLGVSVMEISHRGKDFLALIEEIEQDCRDLLNLPSHYHVLFLSGGARGQFAGIPLNLAVQNSQTAYVVTGLWGKIAAEEAKRYSKPLIVADGEPSQYTQIPSLEKWQDFQHSAYLHYTENETVHGIEFAEIPEAGEVPLVCDMSSSIFSRPLDINRFGLIYAGAQKNIGIAGVTLVIVRDDLVSRSASLQTPSIFNYAIQVKNKSLYNTPPVYPWYIAGLTLKWIKAQGGLTVMGERNRRKAEKLYRFIDQNSFYKNPVAPRFRSRMNVIFFLPDKEKEQLFVQEAAAIGLIGLKGHSSLGGLRASLYNAMPESGVDALIEFMQLFQSKFS